MTQPRRAIIIDSDPGKDDAVAILLALAASDALDIRAITVVAGNVPLALTQRNACALVELAGRTDVPVHAGCTAPALRALVTAEHVHGPSGLDGAGLPDPTLPLAEAHAVDAIIRIVMEAPEREITLCALGPLTNVAAALAREKRIAGRLREIVLMGGAIGLGNVTPSAEFNIFVDPHAAETVFGAKIPIVMVPLEVTHQALVTPEWIKAVAALGTSAGRAVAGMLQPGLARPSRRHKGRGVPLHDPCAIGYLLWPELFSGTNCHVAIETQSELTLGRTVVDRWNAGGKPANALVLERIDDDAFLARLLGRLKALR